MSKPQPQGPPVTKTPQSKFQPYPSRGKGPGSLKVENEKLKPPAPAPKPLSPAVKKYREKLDRECNAIADDLLQTAAERVKAKEGEIHGWGLNADEEADCADYLYDHTLEVTRDKSAQRLKEHIEVQAKRREIDEAV
jgi:hypothetical protein